MDKDFENLDDLFESIKEDINDCEMEGEIDIECPKCNVSITTYNKKFKCPNCGEEINIIFNMEK